MAAKRQSAKPFQISVTYEDMAWISPRKNGNVLLPHRRPLPECAVRTFNNLIFVDQNIMQKKNTEEIRSLFPKDNNKQEE